MKNYAFYLSETVILITMIYVPNMVAENPEKKDMIVR